MKALLDVTAFKGMDSAVLDRIEASSRVLVPRDGAGSSWRATAADAVPAIITGHVRLGAPDTNSKGLMIDIFGPWRHFGEMGVIEHSTRTADAVDQGRVWLLRIGGKVFLDARPARAPHLVYRPSGLITARAGAFALRSMNHATAEEIACAGQMVDCRARVPPSADRCPSWDDGWNEFA